MGGIPSEMVDNSPLYVVVGGSSSLGAAVVSGLTARNRRVISTFMRDRPAPGPGEMHCDVTSLDDCRAVADRAFSQSRKVFVVCLSGISVSSMIHKTNPDDWNRVLNVNLGGAFQVARAFLPGMREAGYGRLAFAGSVAGRLGAVGTGSYSASKEGLRGLVRVIACENASKGISANTIEIGYMDSGLTNTIPEAIRESIRGQIPAGRFGAPGELTPVLLMLEEASYVNGSVITISGGL